MDYITFKPQPTITPTEPSAGLAMRVILAADGFGSSLARAVVEHLRTHHPEVQVDDRGVGDKYYMVAREVAGEVEAAAAAGGEDRAILCCGSGQGMAIIANKFPHVFAALCSTPEGAAGARSVNNANVLCMGGNVVSEDEGCRIVDAWLSTQLAEGWEPPIQQFIRDSMPEIAQLDFSHPQRTGSNTAAGDGAAA